ncbi:MAG: hypothetical protein DRO36_07195 [Candidatus Hecatellales archaeon]|nr:MAG: hypothetical protein DRO36_07195 [Candidatus Hecatellales archaeon]
MNRAERLELFRTNLAKIEKKEEAFVIFEHPKTQKFIQFASRNGEEGFIANVPIVDVNNLTREEIERLRSLGEVSESDMGFDEMFKECSLEEAVVLAERFFREVCLFFRRL